MENLSIHEKFVSGMCRLCLSGDGTLIDMFSFSAELESPIVDSVTKCTSVHVEKHSKLPTTICRPCYMQLVKTQNFQMQALKSDRTLQLFLEQLQDDNDDDRQNIPRSSVILPDIDGNSFIETNAANQYKQDNSTNCEEIINDFKYSASLREEPEMVFVENKVFTLDSKTHTEWDVHSSSKDFTFNPNLIVKAEPIINDKEDQFDIDAEILNDFAVCQKNFKLENEVAIDKTLNSYQCDVCNKSFCNSANLRKHQRIHTDEKLYECKFCNKSFSFLTNLNIHKRIHSGEKPYQCNVCNRCFSKLNTLKTHRRVHTGEQSYQCDVCNKCFSKLDSLKIHHRVHTGEKPYKCDACNKCFSNSANLRRHQRVHTGEKPYQCDVCNKYFNESGTLKRHQRVHTGEKPYQCDVCKKCFSLLSSLKSHKLKHSSND